MKKLFFMLTVICINSFAQPIEFVVTTGAGGPSDYITRKVSELIEKNSNIVTLVVNKPGAGQKIGYDYVEKSEKPTLLISTSEILEFDVLNTVEMLYDLGRFDNLIFTKAGRYNSLKELTNQKEVKFGHGGEKTFSYRSMVESCKKMNCLPVPFKSGSEGLLNVASGTIDAYAVVGYGTRNFTNNEVYNIIGRITLPNNWLRLYAKNITTEQKQKIVNILKNTDKSFFIDMGLK